MHAQSSGAASRCPIASRHANRMHAVWPDYAHREQTPRHLTWQRALNKTFLPHSTRTWPMMLLSRVRCPLVRGSCLLGLTIFSKPVVPLTKTESG